MNAREAILAAFCNLISEIGAVPGRSMPVKVRRNAALPSDVTRSACIIINDGEPGQPEVTLSPLAYHYEHEVELVVALQEASDPFVALDALVGAIGLQIVSHRTLAGCNWIEASAPVPYELPVDGGASITAARIAVTLVYTLGDPLA